MNGKIHHKKIETPFFSLLQPAILGNNLFRNGKTHTKNDTYQELVLLSTYLFNF